MDYTDVLQAWGRIVAGQSPSLSIEITKECPLRCPGCYAYDDDHLGGGVTLRQVADLKGDALIQGVLRVVRQYRPLHLSIVGGDPLVRFRELEILLPELHGMGIEIQLVTSAFRTIPAAWARLPRLTVAVSVDGLPPEHDVRRRPATYDRILQSIAGHTVTIHCTITGQMMQQPDYLGRFLEFWTPRREVARVWMSMFTPQKGDESPECLSAEARRRAIDDLLRLRRLYPKLAMPEMVIREFDRPPESPAQCAFAQTTVTLSADLKTKIAPCQFGGTPDCSRCGCMASMGLAAISHYRLVGGLTPGHLLWPSLQFGKFVSKFISHRAP